MAETASPPRRSALQGHYLTGRFGAVSNDRPGIVLTERRALAIVHVDAWADRVDYCAEALREGVDVTPPGPLRAAGWDTAILSVGPGRWLIVEKETRDLYRIVKDVVGDDLGTVTDQGHARVCWRLTGPALRQILAKGSTLDFDRFGDGDCVGTLLGHFTVTLHGRGPDSADVYAARSFAPDLHHWLVEACLEYGVQIDDPV